MKQTAVFHWLIATSVATTIVGGTVDVFIPGLLPATLQEAYDAHAAENEPSTSHMLALGGLMLILIVGGALGTIGLWLFKPWGRQLCLGLSVLGALISPFFGPVVYSSWSSMLMEISATLWGAVLAMAYFAEVKARFARA